MFVLLRYEGGLIIFIIIVDADTACLYRAARGRAAVKLEHSRLPIDRGVVELEPVMSQEQLSMSKVRNTKVDPFSMVVDGEGKRDHFFNWTILIGLTISIEHRYRTR